MSDVGSVEPVATSDARSGDSKSYTAAHPAYVGRLKRAFRVGLVPAPQKSRLSATVSARSRLGLCLSSTRGEDPSPVALAGHDGGTFMKKLVLPMVAVLALLSIAACAQYVGKGKAPPPVVTKG